MSLKFYFYVNEDKCSEINILVTLTIDHEVKKMFAANKIFGEIEEVEALH